MDDHDDDRFGRMAIHLGFIDTARLAEAMALRRQEPGRSLGMTLVDLGWLSLAESDRVTALVRAERFDATGLAAGRNEMDTTERLLPNEIPPEDTRARPEHSLSGTVGTWEDGWEIPDDEHPGFGRRYVGAKVHGRGGLGLVWKAVDSTLDRVVALKQLRPGRETNPIFARRLIEEARITASLVHPNIVPILDLSEWNDQPSYAMPFLDGGTLRDAIRDHHQANGGYEGRGFLALIDAFIAVASAIGHAHSKGVIHRDIKGENVVFGANNEVIVLDWGLARRLVGGEDVTAYPVPDASDHPDATRGARRPGEALGTPSMMPPEQAQGNPKQIGIRSDIFGLGALLYVILADRSPYKGDSLAAVIAAAKACDPPPPSRFAFGIPPALEAICGKAMRPDPSDRYASTEELVNDIRAWRDDDPVAAYPEALPARLSRWGRKNPKPVAWTRAASIAIGVMLIIGLLVTNRQKARIAEEASRADQARRVADEFAERSVADLSTSLGLLADLLQTIGQELPAEPDGRLATIRLNVAFRAFERLKPLFARYPRNEAVVLTMCNVIREVAKVCELSYRFEDADRLYTSAIFQMNALGPDSRLSLLACNVKAQYWIERGDAARMRADAANAEIYFGNALNLTKACVERDPSVASYLRTNARALLGLGLVRLDRGASAEAEIDLDRAGRAFDDLARAGAGPFDMLLSTQATIERGALLSLSGRLNEAREVYETALGQSRRLVAGASSNTDCRYLLALSLLGSSRVAGSSLESDAKLDEAIQHLEELASERPDVAEYRHRLAESLIDRGARAADLGATQDPGDLSRAREDLASMLRASPSLGRGHLLLGQAAAALARIAARRGDRPEAVRLVQEARDEYRKEAAKGPTREDLGELDRELGAILNERTEAENR